LNGQEQEMKNSGDRADRMGADHRRTCASLEARASELKEKLNRREEEMKSVRDRTSRMETDHRRTCASLEARTSDLKEKLNRREEEMKSIRDRTSRMETELRRTCASLESQLKEAWEKQNYREDEIKTLRDQSNRMEAEHSQTRTLLEARTLELKGAQSFLTTADSLSGAEVSSMTEGLNAEILQASAFMADSFKFRWMERDSRATLTEARTRTENILGPQMLKMLSSVCHSEDPLVVQIALQACMTKLASLAIEAWHLNPSRDPGILADVYLLVRDTGMFPDF